MISSRALMTALRPTDREILALATAETTPAFAHRFEPICRGPLVALVALGLVGLAVMPSLLWRIARVGMGRLVRSDPV